MQLVDAKYSLRLESGAVAAVGCLLFERYSSANLAARAGSAPGAGTAKDHSGLFRSAGMRDMQEVDDFGVDGRRLFAGSHGQLSCLNKRWYG